MLDADAVSAFQFTGAGHPLAARPLGGAQARPNLPGLGTARRRGAALDVRRVPSGGRRSRRGPGRSRRGEGQQGPDPRRQLSGDGARVVRVRAPRRRRRHDEHPQRRIGDRVLRRAHGCGRRDHAAALCASRRRPCQGAALRRGHRRQLGRGGERRGGRPRPRAVRCPARGREPAARARGGSHGARRDHVHFGHDVAPEGRRPHARQRALGESHGAVEHQHGGRRHLPRLPALLPRERQSWSFWTTLGVGGTVVLSRSSPPAVSGKSSSSTTSPTSPSSPSSSRRWPRSPSRITSSRSASSA